MTTQHSNVDHSEIGKFDELASRWWDPESEFRPLHEINPLRLDWIEKQAGMSGKKVIDVGCGGGILAESMAARGAEVTGIDMAPSPLQVAKLHLKESGQQVDYQQSTAEHMASEHAGQFDIVTCMEMLEHVPDPASVVEACMRLTKPGGWVFLSTINRNPKSFAMAIVGAEYVLNLLPKGTHEYAKFIRPSELSGWCRTVGLELKEMIGLHYNPFTRNYSLAPGVDVNYLISCRVPDDHD
ncbi:MAG TPA: bifunctional 3-demethylubiquinol 3-O-methyltransferase/2-polyprenyl-6-hydroxyphenol methylase [Gammaproteobacteria bacterium]|nr:bifunctional 3-demethylubiquinol 3-O-methyltransferase/2-polyprenyl-6-hydroxyphenol methylase [Gammaproteobacteria bacterium]